MADTSLPTRQQFPTCHCTEGFSGPACATLDSSRYEELTVPMNSGSTALEPNTLDIGTHRTYLFPVNAGDGVLVQLSSHSPAADAILLGQPGRAPPLVREFDTAFDGPAWIQHKVNHTLSVGVVTDGYYFVRVINGRYATEPLTYTLTFERHTDCRGGLQQCNGHGSCDKQCKCEDGYEGVRCELEVPTLPLNGPTVQRTVGVGEWEYFVYQSGPNATEVEFKLTGTNIHKKSFPLLMVGATTQRRANNLRLVTDESAFFDYDGYTSAVKDQTLLVRRKGVAFYFIGVHNTRNSWQPVQVALSVTERKVPAFDASSCSTSAATQAACDRDYCHSRGAIATDTNGHPFCVCESGWASSTLCGTPRFSSFVNLLAAAQEVGFLCNLCNFDIPMEDNGLRVYSIPQPLQKQTGRWRIVVLPLVLE